MEPWQKKIITKLGKDLEIDLSIGLKIENVCNAISATDVQKRHIAGVVEGCIEDATEDWKVVTPSIIRGAILQGVKLFASNDIVEIAGNILEEELK